MGKKFESIQARAIKIIHHHPEFDQERRYMTILNQKKFKADLLIFKCLQGTTILKRQYLYYIYFIVPAVINQKSLVGLGFKAGLGQVKI